MLKFIFSIPDRFLGKCFWRDRGNETQTHLINWTETQTEISPAPHLTWSYFFKNSLNFIRLLRVVITPSVTRCWEEKMTQSNWMNFRLFWKLIFKGYVVFSLFCIQDTSTLLQHCLFAGLWWGVCLLLTCKSYMPCQYNADSSVTDDQPYLFSSYLKEQSNSSDKPM